MARIIFSTLFVLFLGLQTQAQTFSDIVSSSEIPVTFLGLDFSNANFIGSDGFANPRDIRDRFFHSWNMLMVNEADKYNLMDAFQKSEVMYEIDMVEERNEEVDWGDMVSDKASNAEHLSEDDISKIVSQYNLSGLSGVGLVFIIESFNKIDSEGNMYVTFIIMDNNKVLFTERMTGRTGGIGLRNYWARTVYNVLIEIEKKRYKKWKSQYRD